MLLCNSKYLSIKDIKLFLEIATKNTHNLPVKFEKIQPEIENNFLILQRNGDLFFFEEDWSDYEVDFMQIAAHEFGHSLGLGHDKDPNSVMYEFFEYKNNFSLHSNDKYRITVSNL